MHDFQVNIGPGVLSKALEKVGQQFHEQVAHLFGPDAVFVNQGGATSEIDRGYGQGLIHGQNKISGAVDADPISESRSQELPQNNADIFHCVMLIDVEIARGLQTQIKGAMFGEELEHVIEKTDTRGNLVSPLTIENEAS